MKDKVNIICLFWVGDYRGRAFTETDIYRLRETVDKWIDRPYDFYCLTNRPDADLPAIKILFKHTWPGWWAKVELFRPDLPCGKTLYLDTDTHIVRSLQPILDFPCKDLVMFPSKENKKIWGVLHSDGWVHRYQASTMLFQPGALVWLYYKFKENAENYMGLYRGEQDMYGKLIPNQPTFPREWLLKTEALKTGLPEETIIVTGQGPTYDFRDPWFAPNLNKIAREKEVCM
jgi:hypothetical protein